MKPTKALRLDKEVLTELSPADLTNVAGGSHVCLTLPAQLCLSVRYCQISHNLTCELSVDSSCLC